MSGNWNNTTDNWNGGGADGNWNEGGFGDDTGYREEIPGSVGEGGKTNNNDACHNPGIFHASVPSLAKRLVLVSTVVKKATTRRNAQTRAFSRELAAFARRKGIRLSNVRTRPQTFAKTAKAKSFLAEKGHKTKDCTENRKFDQHDIPDKMPEEAWAILKKASDERDLEDFREALKIYSKAVPLATFDEIEKRFRADNFKIYLIGLEREIGDTLISVNLQGKLNCKYVVGFYFSEKPHRANLKSRWPRSPEENIKRLADAGFPMDRQVPKCDNCGERNPDHHAKQCPEPRSAEGVECKKCQQAGHMSRDCPEEKDWSKVQCTNCKEMGHTFRRCNKPAEGADSDNADSYGGFYGAGYGSKNHHDQTRGRKETTAQSAGNWYEGPTDGGAVLDNLANWSPSPSHPADGGGGPIRIPVRSSP
ncbi:hypothetical protein CISG_05437 [Coccidioides immitis RMSCC 3703]|uniref:CCHC-type domain-containing protein n=1 Tax=Coccidioides immitis RMSCC 3703 TaxID=454286 RepID=A0A0J8TQD1_COCIT|nr:hypothetical protein CISG_05437 [Coccidioides immitis RMSCC 3703]